MGTQSVARPTKDPDDIESAAADFEQTLHSIAGRLTGIREGLRNMIEDFSSLALLAHADREHVDKLAWLSAVLEDALDDQAESLKAIGTDAHRQIEGILIAERRERGGLKARGERGA